MSSPTGRQTHSLDMASHTPQEDDKTTRPDADTSNIKIIDILCKSGNLAVHLPSNLTRTQIGFVIVVMYVIFTFFHSNILESFLFLLGIFAIVVLWIALCLLYDYVKGKLKSTPKPEGKDLEKQTSATKSIEEDRKEAPGAQETEHDDDLLLGVRGASDYTPPKAVRETRARGEKRAKDDREDEPGAQEPEHDDDLVLEGPAEPFAYFTSTMHRGFAAPSGQKKGVRRYFNYIKERVSSDWKDLALCLGFESPDIDNIEARNHGDKSRCMDMLQEWLKRIGEEATIERLMESLSEAEMRSVVDGLRDSFPELAAQHETSV